MAKDYYLPYLGNIAWVAQANKASVCDSNVVFVTKREEGLPGALYYLNPDSDELLTLPLKTGGEICVQDGENTWVAGSDCSLYLANFTKRSVKSIGKAFDEEIVALAILSKKRLAVLVSNTLLVVSDKGKVLQRFELDTAAVCVAADTSGDWCVVGTQSGQVSVLTAEGQDEFLLSETEKLHEGAVESLLFEAEELRFYSSGADRKFLSTYARGKLEAEDRGRDGVHEARVSAMVNTPGERLITGSHDKTCKAWVRNNKSRPATLSGIGKVAHLSLVNTYQRPHLVVHCLDNTLRLFMLDASGKVGDQSLRVYDAYRKAAVELDEANGYKADAREQALQDLCRYGDLKSVDLLNQQIARDSDPTLREKATQLLIDTGHPSVVKHLFPLLKSAQEKIRELAFLGLQKLNADNEFNNLDSAIASKHSNIAFLALDKYAKLAKKDSRAQVKLVEALNANPYMVRAKALFLLEALRSEHRADMDIKALNSRHADLREVALMQLHQRQLLSDSRARTNIKRLLEDKQPNVRRMAFLVSLLAYPALADAIRARDKKIHSDLFDIECFELSEVFSDKTLQKKALPEVKKAPPILANEEYSPLFQGMGSQHIDIALLAVNCLALLRDSRAYGFLLQLSSAPEEESQISVCESFAALGDQRATSRLVALCNSDSARVRDAAFTAILSLHGTDTTSAVNYGLVSRHADVRKRAQQRLIRLVKASPPEENSSEWQLLFDRINDNDASVRSEAFKTILNLQLGGGSEQTLTLLCQSIHGDIRREVQTEAMAEIAKPWAMPLLLSFIDDADKSLREDTLNFLLKRSRGRDLSPLAQALKCAYGDTRRFAIQTLVDSPSLEKQEVLSLALNDDQPENRMLAIKGIVSESDNRELLIQALDNVHSDVRLQAALALARIGEEKCQGVLLEFIHKKEPEKKTEKTDWLAQTTQALMGLSQLGLSTLHDQIKPLLDSPHKAIQQASAEALFWTAEDYKSLAPLRRHQDATVQQFGVLANAISGNKTDALTIIDSDLDISLRLGVILCHLEEFGEHFLGLLNDEINHDCPVLLVILLIAMAPEGPRSKELLLALGSKRAAHKLMSAVMLEYIEQRSLKATFIRDYLGQPRSHSEWQFTDQDIDTLTYILSGGDFTLRVKTLGLFHTLREKKPQHWNLLWSSLQTRYRSQITQITVTPIQEPPQTESFSDLVFGTYLGILREPLSTHYQHEQVGVKNACLSNLEVMAKNHDSLSDSIETVIIQALGDAQQTVRDTAFDILRKRLPAATLAEECLQNPHVDLGVKGLTLLTEKASDAQARQILGKVVSERQDHLALEAAKMLLEIDETLAVGKLGLASHNKQVRLYSAELLLKDYADSAAKKLLYSALDSPYKDVSGYVAAGLAYQRDDRAIDTLMCLLKQEQNNLGRSKVVDLLVRIGSDAAAAALLDLVEAEPHAVSSIWPLHGVGQMRLPAHAERLLKLSEDEKKSADVLSVLFVISGYDQSIHNADEEQVLDSHWQEKQFPRHDAVLAKTMLRALSYNNILFLNECLPGARWAPSPELHTVLETLAKHPQDAFRNRVLEAIGWRVEKRGGRADALLEALEHKSPDTRFIAAEALAKLGRGEGFTILLAAVELMQNLDYRRRAVSALGKLADLRSLDLLLKLAGDSEHALQDTAVEAIGHLGHSDKASDIFSLLQRFVDSENIPLVTNAVKGLRWLNTRDAWQLIRKMVREIHVYGYAESVRALGYAENNEANRQVLFDAISAQRFHFTQCEPAFNSAKRLLDESSFDAEFYLFKSGCYSDSERERRALQRFTEQASAEQIFSLVPYAAETIQQDLALSLLDKSDLQAKVLCQGLEQSNTKLIKASCEVLAQGAVKESAKQVKEINSAVEACFSAQLSLWFEHLALYHASGARKEELASTEAALLRLIWLCGKRQVAHQELSALLEQAEDNHFMAALGFAAVAALALSDSGLQLLAEHIGSSQGAVRTYVASCLENSETAPLKSISLQNLDRQVVQRLAQSNVLAKALASEVANVHYQAYGLPKLVEQKNVSGLAEVANNSELSETARLGAIEALANIATGESDEVLIAIGKTDSNDEELRKSAWRCLRRAKRIRAAG